VSNETQIGQLDRRVTIKQLQTITEPTGEKINTEVVFKILWAKLEDVSGNESEQGKIVALNVRKYTIRYNKQILLEGEKLLVEDIDGVYNINSVVQEGFKEYLTLRCSKRE